MRERVAVAMSGGVDSSVAAALLLEQGYEVIGLTMQLWPRVEEDELAAPTRTCCGLGAVQDARAVARKLGIRHYVLNFREQFQRLVIDPFCDEYARGRTPNPCIRCNTHVKFEELLRRAREIGAEWLATGHYARVGYEEARKRWVIWQAVDKTKDQSYALYELKQEQLARALFPLGEIKKTDTRKRAAELGLAVSEKPDSQQICFVLDDAYGDFLRKWRPKTARPGAIVDRQGRRLGTHRGIGFYTVGQRRRLGLAAHKPLYVLQINAADNQLVVGGKEDLKAQGLMMDDVKYVALRELPQEGKRLRVKIRYNATPVTGTAFPQGKQVKLTFTRAQDAVAPGQAAVCYEEEAIALGGTIISSF